MDSDKSTDEKSKGKKKKKKSDDSWKGDENLRIQIALDSEPSH